MGFFTGTLAPKTVSAELDAIYKDCLRVTNEARTPIDKSSVPVSDTAKAVQGYLYDKPISGDTGDNIAKLMSILVGEDIRPVHNPMIFRLGLCITALSPTEGFGYVAGETCFFIDNNSNKPARCIDKGDTLQYGYGLPTKGGLGNYDMDTEFVRLATDDEIAQLFSLMQNASNPRSTGIALKRFFRHLF